MGRTLVISSAIFSALGGFLFGYDSGIISSSIAQPKFIEYFNNPSNAEAGGIVSSYTGGAIVGALSITYLGDLLGRKRTIFMGACIATFGCALQGGAVTIPMLIAGRFLAGIAVGQLSSTVPIYCSEIAPAKWRGMLSGLLQWMLSWGFFVAQWLGYGCTFATTSFQWRFPLSFQCLPAAVLACGILFLPESPRWLCEKGRDEEAKKVIDRLFADGNNTEYLDLVFIEIQDAIHADKEVAVRSWKAIFTRPAWRRRLMLGCGIQMFGQLSGINVVNYYGPRIYKVLGINTATALKIIGINGTFGIIEVSTALLLVERTGRIKPLIIGTSFMAACMMLLAVLNQAFPYGSAHPDGNALRAQVAMAFVFQLAFTPTGCISWIYPAEIFPTEIRALGASIATLSNWSLNLVISQVSPIALGSIGFNYFYCFMVFNIVAAICYFFFFPETKARTLEQMDEVFGDQRVVHALQNPEEALRRRSTIASMHEEVGGEKGFATETTLQEKV